MSSMAKLLIAVKMTPKKMTVVICVQMYINQTRKLMIISHFYIIIDFNHSYFKKKDFKIEGLGLGQG